MLVCSDGRVQQALCDRLAADADDPDDLRRRRPHRNYSTQRIGNGSRGQKVDFSRAESRAWPSVAALPAICSQPPRGRLLAVAPSGIRWPQASRWTLRLAAAGRASAGRVGRLARMYQSSQIGVAFLRHAAGMPRPRRRCQRPHAALPAVDDGPRGQVAAEEENSRDGQGCDLRFTNRTMRSGRKIGIVLWRDQATASRNPASNDSFLHCRGGDRCDAR